MGEVDSHYGMALTLATGISDGALWYIRKSNGQGPRRPQFCSQPSHWSLCGLHKAVYLSGVQFLHLQIEVIIYDGSSGSYN